MLYDGDAVANGYWQQQFLMQWSSRIGGGTEQIQRNVIGERVLGLPGRAARRQGRRRSASCAGILSPAGTAGRGTTVGVVAS